MRTSRMITAVEAHAEGEGGRVITGGMPHLPGDSVFEKMQYMQAHHDDIRTLMLQEPRGNPALCCNVLVPPCDPRADAGFIIMEQTEYPPMSGSNAICVTTVLLETGIVPMVEPVTTLTLEAPAGLITLKASCKNGKVERVEFMNVPAFAMHIGVPLDVPGYGQIEVDIAWGGMFFVLAEAAEFGIDPVAENGNDIVRASEAMRAAAVAQYPVSHPENPALSGPTISALTAPPTDPRTHGRGAITVSSGFLIPPIPMLSRVLLTAPLAERELVQRWRFCMPKACWMLAKTTSTQAHLAQPLRAALNRQPKWQNTMRLSPAYRVAVGSMASANTCLTPPIHSPPGLP